MTSEGSAIRAVKLVRLQVLLEKWKLAKVEVESELSGGIDRFVATC